jgi:hypothetical protein
MTGVACARKCSIHIMHRDRGVYDLLSGACADAGYALAGTQYSSECRCGNVLDVPSLVSTGDKIYLRHRLIPLLSQVVLTDEQWWVLMRVTAENL